MRFGNIFAFHLTLSLPIFLVLESLICADNKVNSPKIHVPVVQSLLFSFFIFGSIISTYFSADIQKSFEYTLLYSAFFIIYILVYNTRSTILKPFLFSSFIVSTLFSLLSFYLATLPEEALLRMRPWENFQYIYSYLKTSHPIGAIMIFPISLCIPFVFNKNRYQKLSIIAFIVSLSILLMTYMRSAFVAIGISLFTYAFVRLNQIQLRRSTGLLLLISSLLIVFTITLSMQNKPSGIFQNVNLFTIALDSKDNLQSRFEYFRQALVGFSKHPIIGNGPNTFDIVSRKHSYGLLLTDISSHNLILDALSDNGLFGLFFIGFIISVLFPQIMNLRKEKSLLIQGYILTAFSILIMYQVFRFQRFTSHMLYFILVLALITKARTHWALPLKTTLIASVIVFLLSQAIFLSTIMQKNGNDTMAILLYPLNKNAYSTNLILSRNKNSKVAQIPMYSRLVENDYYRQQEISRYYLESGQNDLALAHRLKSYALFPMQIFEETHKVYDLMELVKGKTAAQEFFNLYLLQYNHSVAQFPNTTRYDDQIQTFCEEKRISCDLQLDRYMISIK